MCYRTAALESGFSGGEGVSKLAWRNGRSLWTSLLFFLLPRIRESATVLFLLWAKLFSRRNYLASNACFNSVFKMWFYFSYFFREHALITRDSMCTSGWSFLVFRLRIITFFFQDTLVIVVHAWNVKYSLVQLIADLETFVLFCILGDLVKSGLLCCLLSKTWRSLWARWLSSEAEGEQ